MQQPLISILVPAYNVGSYIVQCLDSIVNQSYRNLQVVIVDDGSTDDTGKICDDYAFHYPFIEVHHIANGGVANARNVLLSNIKGEYFLFVDSDDWIEPDMVESLVLLALQHRLDIVVCDNVIEDGKSPLNILHDTNPPVIWDRRQCVEKFLLHKELNGSLWNKLVLTSLFHNITFDRGISYGEDALAIWHSLHRLNRMGITRSKFYHYRMNADSISHQPFGSKKMSGHLVWKTIYEDTVLLYPDLVKLAKGCYAVSDFWLLYYASIDNYKQDGNIKKFRLNLKKGMPYILKYKLLPSYRLLGAFMYITSYNVMTAIINIVKS